MSPTRGLTWLGWLCPQRSSDRFTYRRRNLFLQYSIGHLLPTHILCYLLTYYAAYLHIMLPTYIIFDMIGVEIQDFQELKPKPETSEQDLDVGRG